MIIDEAGMLAGIMGILFVRAEDCGSFHSA